MANLSDFRRLSPSLDRVISRSGPLPLNMHNAPRRILMPLLLLAVSLRVFTGAAEAQISFTSLISDAHANQSISSQDLNQDGKPILQTTQRAKSIPEKQRSSVTYKKYLTPENSGAILSPVENLPVKNQDLIENQKIYSSILCVKDLRAHAPPKASLVVSPLSAKKTYSIISWESEFGTSKINNSAGGIRSI